MDRRGSGPIIYIKTSINEIFPQLDIYNDSSVRNPHVFLFPLTEQFIISVDILTAIWSSCNLPWKTSLQLQANILFNDQILTGNCDLEVCKNKYSHWKLPRTNVFMRKIDAAKSQKQTNLVKRLKNNLAIWPECWRRVFDTNIQQDW